MEQSPATSNLQSAPLLSTSEAAEILGVTSQTIRNWDDRGTLPAVRTPKGYRFFNRAQVEALAEQRRGGK